jgi:hypothetical protein
MTMICCWDHNRVDPRRILEHDRPPNWWPFSLVVLDDHDVGARSLVGRGNPIHPPALSEKICWPYQRPLPSRPLFRPAQSNFPFQTAVILIEHKDSIGHFKVAVGCAEKAGSITSTRKLMRCGFADWAMEDHRSLPRSHYLITEIAGDNRSG